jgi:soluble lytic murein transglycosylase-like protein
MSGYYKQYGDYAKALAAYNAGSGTVDYAIKAGGANWMSFLPAETRNYIFKIMGI